MCFKKMDAFCFHETLFELSRASELSAFPYRTFFNNMTSSCVILDIEMFPGDVHQPSVKDVVWGCVCRLEKLARKNVLALHKWGHT